MQGKSQKCKIYPTLPNSYELQGKLPRPLPELRRAWQSFKRQEKVALTVMTMRASEFGFSEGPQKGPKREAKRLTETIILENQCESSKPDIFSIYFNDLCRWCPEEASHSNYFSMFYQIVRNFPFCKKPSKGPQKSSNALVRCLFQDSELSPLLRMAR